MIIDELNYKQLRQQRGWTRQEAVDQLKEKKLAISIDRLKDIENTQTKVRPAEVMALSRLYGVPELCYLYCQSECAIGFEYNEEDVHSENLSEIVMQLFLTLEDIGQQELSRLLMKVAQDGKVKDSEIRDLVRAKYALEQLALRVKALQLNVERKLLRGELNEEIYNRELDLLQQEREHQKEG